MEELPHEKQIYEYERTIAQIKEHNVKNPLLSADEMNRLEKKLDKLKRRVYSSLFPWERVLICRHPNRPRSVDYIKNICTDFIELCGDRAFADDRAVVGGLATIGEMKCVIVGQEKGYDTESRLKRNFGMLHPEGFKKALRLAQLAGKFHLPAVFLLDTPGAYPGLTAEERGQGLAIAMNLRELSRIATPMIVLVIGEGCSGGALGMGVGDTIGMLEHSYYSVISPEGCASILWKDPEKKGEAASALKMQAEDLLEFGIIDEIIKEPLGGAHHAPEEVFQGVKAFILQGWENFKGFSKELLLEHRYQKFRKMGSFQIKQ
ncbi:MAG: acetyl-CoA carboxylase carboxyltransferase subunit alpha [Chlamydiia bacterium]|nr:acetyl-CoA carboxylase carboxyltransferase subunit alpha [Chlamydiia bacterium]